MANVIYFSIIELLLGFSQTYTQFLTAAEAIGEEAKNNRSDRTEEQRRRQRGDDLGLRHLELFGESIEEEYDDEEVERIERPAQKSRHDGML